MKPLRVILPVLVAGIIALAPTITYAAAASFFGPIISPECTCRAEGSSADWGCVLQTAQNVVNLVFSLSTIIFVLTIAYAGVLFMTSSLNAENKSKARAMLWHTFIGLLIALCAWLIVDFVMKTLYDEDSGWGPWNTILSEDDLQPCIVKVDPPGAVDGPDGGEEPGEEEPGEEEPGEEIPPEELEADANWRSAFLFDNAASTGNVRDQIGDESSALNGLLSCMAGNLPDGVGRISAISDKRIPDTRSFAQCGDRSRTVSCGHTAGSCHYGGSGTCNGKSYAVDFGDEENLAQLRDVARACATARGIPSVGFNDEGDHLHISVDRERCGCDTGLGG